MLSLIIKLANLYDQLGQLQKADRLDDFIQRHAMKDEEPSPEDLMKEEEWLQDEDPLSGLEGKDLDAAKMYLGGANPKDIPALLEKLEQERKHVLEELSKLMPGQASPDLLPKQQPIIGEASLLQDFTILADQLDQQALTKKADQVDRIISKLAQGLPPDDDDLDWDDDDSFQEPSTEELSEMEHSGDQEEIFYRMMDLIQKLAKGGISPQDAQHEAQEILDSFDQEHDVPTEPLPDNVMKFPGE